jgi:glycosyltransferase involved in cell wall biosynthesis
VTEIPRVAFFTDSFTEVNGVARTSRALAAFAAERDRPMLCVHGGRRTELVTEGSITRLALERSRVGFGLEEDLRFDLLLWRHRRRVAEALRQFAPDLVHITGPGDVGQLGAYLAHVSDVPLVASWHTNLHDFAALRLDRVTRLVPSPARHVLTGGARRQTLKLVLDFYRIARWVLAPNPDLVALIARATGRPVDLMPRGVDTTRFSPAWATPRNGTFRIGYVGRLSPEKSVRVLAHIERELLGLGQTDISMVVVGDGSERPWLQEHLQHGEFPGVLEGERLSRAYANMDVFVFPSVSDTFGNVVLEALASGTPAIVMDQGGPRFIVRHGISGYHVSNAGGFVDAILALIADRDRHLAMRAAAREQALEASWPQVFDGVYTAYQRCLSAAGAPETDAPEIGPPDRISRLVSFGLRAFHAH